VSSTCSGETVGALTTTYNDLEQTGPHTCDALNPHPSQFMTDSNEVTIPGTTFTYDSPDLTTYWQSINTIAAVGEDAVPQWIMFDLQQPFLIRSVRLIFISPHVVSATSDSDMRPLAMCIERQTVTDPTAPWDPLRYYADDCSAFPAVPELIFDPQNPVASENSPVIAYCEERYYATNAETYSGWGFGRQEVSITHSLFDLKWCY